jgi:hypothetical protein
MITRISGVVALMIPVGSPAKAARVQSIWFFGRSDLRGAFHQGVFSTFQQAAAANCRSPIAFDTTTAFDTARSLSAASAARHMRTVAPMSEEGIIVTETNQ